MVSFTYTRAPLMHCIFKLMDCDLFIFSIWKFYLPVVLTSGSPTSDNKNVDEQVDCNDQSIAFDIYG